VTDRQPFETEISIDAPAEAVWAALTQAEQLVGWFAAEARTTPGEGGAIWVSWGDGMEGEDRIEIWEPPSHLRVAGPVDYRLEGDSPTVLRVVHSGFGRDTWEDEYDSVSHGWKVFLRALREYLERHPRARPAARGRTVQMDQPPERAWEALLGPDGLGLRGPLDRLAEGERRAVAALDDDATVLLAAPPRTLLLALGRDALLELFLERGGGLSVLLIAYEPEALRHWPAISRTLVEKGTPWQTSSSASASPGPQTTSSP
jgi:uncharacterized protein YndB with AHSA1/START domain